MEQHTKTSIRKQIVGAAVGGGLALALYAGYTAVEPRLQGLLVTPQTREGIEMDAPVRFAQKGLTDEEQSRMVSRAQRIANDVGSRRAPVHETVEQVAFEPPPRVQPRRTRVPIRPVHPDDVFREQLEQVVHDVNDPWEGAPPVYSPPPEPPPPVEQLPDSGFGLGATMLMAGSMASVLWKRRKRRG